MLRKPVTIILVVIAWFPILKPPFENDIEAVTTTTDPLIKLDCISGHRIVIQTIYQAIEELTLEREKPVIQTGSIYKRYKLLCQTYEEEPLSERRISDYLKHLELLNLIQAEYHYGGRKGKTREIQLNQL